MRGLDEASTGMSVQFWRVVLFLEKILKIQDKFGEEPQNNTRGSEVCYVYCK